MIICATRENRQQRGDGLECQTWVSIARGAERALRCGGIPIQHTTYKGCHAIQAQSEPIRSKRYGCRVSDRRVARQSFINVARNYTSKTNFIGGLL